MPAPVSATVAAIQTIKKMSASITTHVEVWWVRGVARSILCVMRGRHLRQVLRAHRRRAARHPSVALRSRQQPGVVLVAKADVAPGP